MCYSLTSHLLLGLRGVFPSFSGFTELKTTLHEISLCLLSFVPFILRIIIIFWWERGEGKKVWGLFQRAFPESGDSFVLRVIMDEHCTLGFHNSLISR